MERSPYLFITPSESQPWTFVHDFSLRLRILKNSQEKWPLSRFQTNPFPSREMLPAAAWDVLNILLIRCMAPVQQFWSRKYQTATWPSLLLGTQALAGRWRPWGSAGSGCFHTSKTEKAVPAAHHPQPGRGHSGGISTHFLQLFHKTTVIQSSLAS